MTVGKPIRCYPFKKKDGTFIYLPYDKTEFDITFIGDDQELKPIKEYCKPYKSPNTIHAKRSARICYVSRTI